MIQTILNEVKNFDMSAILADDRIIVDNLPSIALLDYLSNIGFTADGIVEDNQYKYAIFQSKKPIRDNNPFRLSDFGNNNWCLEIDYGHEGDDESITTLLRSVVPFATTSLVSFLRAGWRSGDNSPLTDGNFELWSAGRPNPFCIHIKKIA